MEENNTIIRQVGGYCVVQREVAQALRKHQSALGLYTFLLSLPDAWEFKKTWLKKETNLGINKLNRLLSFLSHHNLIKTIQRKVKGKFAEFDMEIYDGKDFKRHDLEPLFRSPSHRYRATETVATEMEHKILEIEITNTKIKNSSSSDDDGERNEKFDQFWQEHPRKVGKKAARKAWNKIKAEQYDNIISDIRLRKNNNWAGKEPQFIPHPASYLNGERWNDTIESKSKGIEKHESTSEKSWRILRESHAVDLANEQRARQNATNDMGQHDLCPLSITVVQ